MCGHHHGRHGAYRAFLRQRFPASDDLLQMLEEHQRDLEQEVADVADLIRRLREGNRPEPATA